MTGSTLTDAEINHLQAKFDSLTKGNGMTADTLKQIYQMAKIEVTDAEINEQIRAADAKGNGKVDFDDFMAVMNKQHETNAEEGVLRVFEMIDTDHDGQISNADLKRGISLFGKSVTDADIEDMMASADVDGDGLINYEEFLKIMTPSKVNGQSLF
ncbi:Calmodulin-4 [Choanephora cucurbitarum]|uniref:Calmodulin-4 n=1 Tax=Choanephora cucurbitarum TaxID=101091 RepID=A0A1C7NDW7_9FUNG|nr:Calmodulin-4 [Choanephora cucurbitarum]